MVEYLNSIRTMYGEPRRETAYETQSIRANNSNNLVVDF